MVQGLVADRPGGQLALDDVEHGFARLARNDGVIVGRKVQADLVGKQAHVFLEGSPVALHLLPGVEQR
jgi:hypothetical protein